MRQLEWGVGSRRKEWADRGSARVATVAAVRLRRGRCEARPTMRIGDRVSPISDCSQTTRTISQVRCCLPRMKMYRQRLRRLSASQGSRCT